MQEVLPALGLTSVGFMQIPAEKDRPLSWGFPGSISHKTESPQLFILIVTDAAQRFQVRIGSHHLIEIFLVKGIPE